MTSTADPDYVDSDNEECYHTDDVQEKQIQELMDQSIDVGKEVRNAFVKRTIDEESSSPEPKRAKLKAGATPNSVLKTTGDDASCTEKAYIRKSYKEGEVKYLPTSKMTGVDPEMARMCAALSGQIYLAKSASEFQLSNDKIGNVEVIKFDQFGKLSETTPPMVIAVTGKAMVIGWRGSQTLMDWILDFAFAPVASRAWVNIAPKVRTQGGFSALVENYLSQYQAFIISEIKNRDISELIFTGHSLAGGLAQVAHLYLNGERLMPNSEWSKITDLTLRCISFSAPMTTMTLDRRHKQSANFIKSVGKNVANIIYESDPVPRAYAEIHFINKLVKNAVPQIADGIPIPGFLKWTLGLQKRIMDAIESTFTSQKELIEVMSTFRHIGNVIYYADETSAPKVYIDKGFAFKKPRDRDLSTSASEPMNLFRDIPYVESKDVLRAATDNHNFLVSGPGMAYNIKRDEL